MMESDEQLYSRYLAQRSEGDFRILLERHRESLMLFLYSFVHSMEDAEELTLDAYAEAAAGANYAGKSTFKTWLFSIGKNLALMHLRKRRYTAEEPLEQAEETADPPEMNILREEENLRLSVIQAAPGLQQYGSLAEAFLNGYLDGVWHFPS